MSEPRGDGSPDADGDDALLADWAAELAERLEGGESIDLDALAEAHPGRAEELRRILPTIRRMAELGRAVAGAMGPPGAIVSGGPGGDLGSLGDFRPLREVGRGGMGIVYEAEQISLRRRVALKILPPAAAFDPRNHQRFLLEARAAACLHHAHIVPVYAVGSERGVPYYAMQFIEGCTLAQVLGPLRGRADRSGPGVPTAGFDPETAPLPTEARPVTAAPAAWRAAEALPSPAATHRDRSYIRAAADRGRQAAEALDHAHSRGILHRDIKPANLMIDVKGHLWITDFGLARIQGDSGLTLTGDVLGTLRYMSPEQALARRVVIDGRTDIYSLGATLYELLALRPVFDGADRTEILRRIAQDEPTPLRKLNPAVPRDLETVVHKALAKEPGDRYQTARELADDLGRFLDSRPIAARPPGRLERIGRWARRNRAAVVPAAIFAAAALLALAGGLIWSNNWLRVHGERLRLERDRAEEFSRRLEAQRDIAERGRRIADSHLYAFAVRQAGEALRARQFEKAQEILRDCRPGPGEDDPREFTWHYLWGESRREMVVLSERGEHVWSLALSADGRTVATGDRDGTIRLRDADTGALGLSLRGHHIPISALAFSPDGRRLASGTAFEPDDRERPQGELLVWDTASGRLLARLDGFERREVGSLRFDSSGEFLWERSGSPGDRPGIHLWGLEGHPGAPRPRLLRRWDEGRPSNVPVSADGRRVAVYRDEGRVVAVEEAVAGREVCRLPRDPRGYEWAALSGDGRLVATAARDTPDTVCRLAVWEVDTGRLVADHRVNPFGGVAQLEFGPGGRGLIARSDEGRIRQVTVDTRETWRIDPEPRDEWRTAGDFAILAGGRWLAWGDLARRAGPAPLRIHDRATGAVRATFPGRPEAAGAMAGRPDGRSLVFKSGPRAVAWHFGPPPPPAQPAGHSDEAWALGFSGDNRLLASGSDDTDDPRTLKLWDAGSGRLLRGWRAHDATTSAVAFQPGHPVIASAGLLPQSPGLPRANLRLWDAETGTLLATLDGHTDKVRTVAFSPDGRRLASAGSDRMIRLWDVAARRCVRALAGHADVIRQVSFSPDGRTLASVGNDLTVRLWDVDRGEEAWSWKGSVKVATVAFSPDGRTLAWAHEDGVIQRRDLAQGRLLAPLHSEYDELRCLGFTPDGRTLAAAGKSGDIHLWDPVSGQELLTLEGRPSQANALAFSPDGRSLAVCWHDGAIRLFRAD